MRVVVERIIPDREHGGVRILRGREQAVRRRGGAGRGEGELRGRLGARDGRVDGHFGGRGCAGGEFVVPVGAAVLLRDVGGVVARLREVQADPAEVDARGEVRVAADGEAGDGDVGCGDAELLRGWRS